MQGCLLALLIEFTAFLLPPAFIAILIIDHFVAFYFILCGLVQAAAVAGGER